MSLAQTRILLIITGGIAAYKSLDLIRRLRERGAAVRPVMTQGAQAFVTPLAVGVLAADTVFTELFSREDEQDVGHIRLARECDLVLVAPATASIMAKMSYGLADDLASTILLATDRPVLLAPAMNPKMWSHPATLRNRAILKADGIAFVGPDLGEMAESGERGEGRMADVLEIVAAVERRLEEARRHPQAEGDARPLAGRHAIVTSGPTHEPIDPVRYIANRSSGRQGHAIAAALARLGATVTLVSGPVTLPDPQDVTVVRVETAIEMRDAVIAALPADIAVMVAAVADWRVADVAGGKIKKAPGAAPPPLRLAENPDILKTIGHHDRRPAIVVGFAAETDDTIANGRAKRARKGADYILANDVSVDSGVDGGVMGGTRNRVTVIGRAGEDAWPELDKTEVADRLAHLIAEQLNAPRSETAEGDVQAGPVAQRNATPAGPA